MRLALTLPLFLAAFAMPLAAQAADPRVEDQGAGLFAVFPAGGLSASEAFCTAGGFAQARLGLGPTDRIWRVTPVPRRSGQPMVENGHNVEENQVSRTSGSCSQPSGGVSSGPRHTC